MRLISKFKSFLPTRATQQGPMSLRRWEAAKTSRLNSAHWSSATGTAVNADIETYVETLRNRCLYEAANNAFVDGVIEQFANDVLGKHGPILQVQSESAETVAALEAAWSAWWENPDATGRQSGVDMLRLWIRNLWTMGEFVAQKTTSRDGDVSLRLVDIDPRRMFTPLSGSVRGNVVLGVDMDDIGKPMGYYIANAEMSEAMAWDPASYTYYNAADVIHGYRAIEGGQVRGVPWLASCLQDIADLKDYDDQVMDAARNAAAFSLWMFTNHPDANFVEFNESTEIERRMLRSLPPGYQVQATQANQPATNYVEFHDERLRGLGRNVGMPLMIIKGDSRNHNYSSARFDAQGYHRNIQSFEGWLERTLLNRVARAVFDEVRVRGGVKPGYKITWTWPGMPHVDPLKEAKAEAQLISTGTMTFADACAAHGKDWEQQVQQLKRETGVFDDAGLKHPREYTTPDEPPPDGTDGANGDNGDSKE